MLKMSSCGCRSFSFVIRFYGEVVDMYVNESAGPCQGNIFDGSLVLWERAHVCLFPFSFLRTASFFPILPLSSYHCCSLGFSNFFSFVQSELVSNFLHKTFV